MGGVVRSIAIHGFLTVAWNGFFRLASTKTIPYTLAILQIFASLPALGVGSYVAVP